MRQFKRKNRQKRKYVRRSPVTAHASTAQSFLTGLIPSVLVVLIFLMVVLISTQPIRIVFSFQMPTLPWTQVFISLQWVTDVTIAFFTTIFSLVTSIIHVFASCFAFSFHVIWVGTKALASLTQVVLQAIVFIIQTTIHTIITFLNVVIDTIFLPFKMLGDYMAQLKPYVSAFGHLVALSGDEFVTGLNNAAMFFSEVTKLSQH